MFVNVVRRSNRWVVVVDDMPGVAPGLFAFDGIFNVPVKIMAVFVNMDAFDAFDAIPFNGTLPVMLFNLINDRVKF